jgi:hypothetical protein
MPTTFARADPIQYLIDQSMRRNRIERRDIFDDFPQDQLRRPDEKHIAASLLMSVSRDLRFH